MFYFKQALVSFHLMQIHTNFDYYLVSFLVQTWFHKETQ